MLFSDTHGQKPSRSWLDLPPSTTARWDDAVVADHLVAHLNLQGEAEIQERNSPAIQILPGTLWWLRGDSAQLQRAVRMPRRERHHCLTLRFPLVWTKELVAGVPDDLPPPFAKLINDSGTALLSHQRPLSPDDAAWAQGLMPEHLCVQARALLDSVRLTEFILREWFAANSNDPDTDEPISRTERLSRERVDQAKEYLLQHLDQPLALDELAQRLSCNPQHLSRTFSRIQGLPLSLWLRRERINRAADLIASGRFNVSEASLEVGYSSFSHFSSAFLQEKGVQPSRWVSHITG